MQIIAIGDVVGRPGRQILETLLPKLHQDFRPDAIILNGENIAGGFGITPKIYNRCINELGITCITTGNHWADKRDVYEIFKQPNTLLIPENIHNFDSQAKGWRIVTTPAGPIAVMNLIGQVFMHANNRCPFEAADQIIAQIPDTVKVRICDFHGEATSEKQGMGWHLAERASLVYGTHSHVPTMDHRIFSQHTGFVTDIGMSGAYESVIGMKVNLALKKLRGKEKVTFQPAKGDPRLSFVVADIDQLTGVCKSLQKFLWGPDILEKL
jgi:2',3'-cyclic-nucleotide 2'-phosphodiesterase